MYIVHWRNSAILKQLKKQLLKKLTFHFQLYSGASNNYDVKKGILPSTEYYFRVQVTMIFYYTTTIT